MSTLIGYVSDEMDIALAGVRVELSRGDELVEVRSTASGQVRRERARRALAGRAGAARLWTQDRRGRHRPGRAAPSVPPPLGPPARLRLAQVGARRRPRGAAGPLARSRTRPRSGTTAGSGARSGTSGASSRSRPVATARSCRTGTSRSTGVRLEPPWPALPARRPGVHHGPGTDRALLRPPRGGRRRRLLRFPLVVAPREPVRARRRARLEHRLERLQRLRWAQQLRRVAGGSAEVPVINPHQDGPMLRDTGARFWDRDDYAPLSLRPTGAGQPDRARRPHHRRHGPHRRGARRARDVAPRRAGWSARASRTTSGRRRSSTRATLDLDRLQGARPRPAPRVLVARDVLRGQGLGLRTRRAARVPRRQRHPLRGGARRRGPRRHPPQHGPVGVAPRSLVRGRARLARPEPLRPARRERGEPAGRLDDAHGHGHRRAVPGRRRRPLVLRGHRARVRATCSARSGSTRATPVARRATRPTR